MSRRCKAITEHAERRLVTSHHVICWFHTNESSMSLWLAFRTPHFQVAMICGGPRADNFFKTISERTFHGYKTLIGRCKILQYGGPQLSLQNQKPHGKNKIPHGKLKPNTSQQNQNSFGFVVGICFCREIFGFCCEVFGFAVRFLVLLWGILFLPWGFRFCREVFCFCREVFGFAVRYFVFAVRFLVLPWQLWATVLQGIIQHLTCLTITSKINV